MSKTLTAAETLSDMEVEHHVLTGEIGKLKKMLLTGFEGKQIGFDKAARVLGSGETEEIAKLYDLLGGLIKAVKYLGSEEKLQNYLKINHSITYECNATPTFNKNNKKFLKFKDAYNSYFLDPPTTPTEATSKILSSISANAKEYKVEGDKIKEEFEALSEKIDQSPGTLKHVTNILTKAKLKDLSVSDIVSEIEDKIADQQTALDIATNDQTT